jgi:hypothetical protein
MRPPPGDGPAPRHGLPCRGRVGQGRRRGRHQRGPRQHDGGPIDGPAELPAAVPRREQGVPVPVRGAVRVGRQRRASDVGVPPGIAGRRIRHQMPYMSQESLRFRPDEATTTPSGPRTLRVSGSGFGGSPDMATARRILVSTDFGVDPEHPGLRLRVRRASRGGTPSAPRRPRPQFPPADRSRARRAAPRRPATVRAPRAARVAGTAGRRLRGPHGPARGEGRPIHPRDGRRARRHEHPQANEADPRADGKRGRASHPHRPCPVLAVRPPSSAGHRADLSGTARRLSAVFGPELVGDRLESWERMSRSLTRALDLGPAESARLLGVLEAAGAVVWRESPWEERPGAGELGD